jgi:protein gp37
MSDNTAIEWTDATWNPIVGCSVVSPGCTNCYAMRLAGTRLRHHPTRKNLTTMSKAGPVWNGQVRLNEATLDQPLRWRRPRKIFVCAHGDLFHESVPDAWIDRVFAVMALAPRHTFQVLTKRAERMRGLLRDSTMDDRLCELNQESGPRGWPLRNVHLGVSIEDQTRAEERIPLLLQTPAAVRFVSAEPLLGPVMIPGLYQTADRGGNAVRALDWVIVGGESGLGARPMHPDWARELRDQCVEASVPFFFKQWGEWAPAPTPSDDEDADYRAYRARGGRDMHLWSTGFQAVELVGKRRAGRLLDGRTWDEFPA